MASNFFTRPHGLHPTPSACFPPPPPVEGGIITGSVVLTPNPCLRNIPINLATFVENAFYQTGVPVAAVYNLPGINPFHNDPVYNRQQSTGLGTAGNVPGFFSGTAKFTWPNGQVRTIPINYRILP